MVTSETQLVTLLGNPLKQTFSPQMHNEAFEKLELDYFYYPIEVESCKLPAVVEGIRNMRFAGFNVTKPYKLEIIKYLDELDDLARTIGSVNTVVIRDGKLKGYNTDGEGFVRALFAKTGMDISKQTFLVLGAGGASRAVCSTLAFKGARKIYVVGRNSSTKGASLVKDINSQIKACAELVEGDETSFPQYVKNSTVIVNATGVGMAPFPDETPFKKELLRKELFLIDCCYNPAKTRFLMDGEAVGCECMSGLGMLIQQGAMAFSLWTGVPGPVDTMTGTIRRILKLTLRPKIII